MGEIPDYVIERIRQTPPQGCSVVPGSTPVISFGDASKAHVATVGINPSCREFYDNHIPSGVQDAQQVFADCNRYFHRNPYKWFDKLSPVLGACGVSYYDDSACSLDLVQWATDPVWGKLTKEQKEELLGPGTKFLKRQLRENQNIRLVLANGAGVIDHLREWLGFTFRQTKLVARFSVRDAPLLTSIFTDGLREVPIIGWRVNLQSDHGAYGVTNAGIAELAKRVGELYRNGC